MRKITLLVFMLYSSLLLHAQEDGAGKGDWTPWVQDPCFKNLYFSVKSNGYHKGTNKYWYIIKFKNTSSQNIHFSFKSTFDDTGEKFMSGRFDVRAGAEFVWTSIPFETAPRIKNGKVSFPISYNIHSYLENPKDDWTLPSFACDYTTKKAYCDSNCDKKPGNNKNNSSGDQTNQNQNSTSQTNSEIENLNQYLTKIPDSDAEKIRIINDANAITNSTSLTDSQKAGRIKGLTDQARLRAERLSSEETARKAEEDRQRKILEERDGFMRNHLQKGDDAYNSGQYANAKIHYSNALGFATTDEQRQQIQAAISKAQLAIEAEARRQRVEQKQKVEQQNNTAAAGGIGAGIGILALLHDEESEEFFSAKFRFGLGIEWIPLLTNSTIKQRTRTDIVAPYTLYAGFKMVVGNDRPVALHLYPEGSYGLMAFIPGSDGYAYNYGLMAGVHAGKRPESMFKAVAEAGILQRGGSLNYDGDAANGGTTATDEVYNGTFNYGVTRLGGGVLFQIHDYDEIKFFIKPMYYFDKFSFGRKAPFTKMLGVSLGSSKLGILDILFSTRYGIAGSIDYPQSFNPLYLPGYGTTENESYFQIKYSRQILIR